MMAWNGGRRDEGAEGVEVDYALQYPGPAGRGGLPRGRARDPRIGLAERSAVRAPARGSGGAVRDHVVAASNGTGALIAALTVLGEPGAEAIIPGYTFTATWGAVRWAGMVPVVADVDARGLLDPAAVAAAVTPRTRVIVPVPIAGQPAPMAELRGIADRAGARIVADAAHAFGSRHVDRPVGADGDAEVFSIGATKPLATDPLATLMSRLASVAPVSTGEARACPTRGASA